MESSIVSVLMSAYNEPIHYVQQAVDSMTAQTYKNIEIIFVVDNPNNQSLIDLLSYVAVKDSRIKVIINEKNIGLAMSLNKALNMSTGDIVARMDADDISKPERLEKELDYLLRNNLDIIGCAVEKIDENGQVWGTIESYSNNPEDYARLLPVQNVLVHPSTMMKANVIKKIGGYRNFSSCQDYDLWLRLLTVGCKFGVCPEKLFQFRRHRQSITATRRYGQILNEAYIRKLYEERQLNQGKDSFTEDHLKAYLTENGFYDQAKYNRQNELLICYNQGVSELKKKKYISGLRNIAKSLNSRAVRNSIMLSAKSKKIRKQIIRK